LRSTSDAIERVVSMMKRTIRDGLIGAVISLDVAGAFDTAWWPAILLKLKRSKIPHNIWHLCSDYFSDRTAELELGGCTATKSVSRGCPQGSACGPAFWNVLYDDVLGLKMPINCEVLAFADDLV